MNTETTAKRGRPIVKDSARQMRLVKRQNGTVKRGRPKKTEAAMMDHDAFIYIA